MSAKLLRWLIFSIVVALLPFVFNYIRFLYRGSTPTLDGILGNGDLLLVCAAVSAAAIGDLIGSGHKNTILKLLAGGGNVIILSLCSWLFADVSSTISIGQPTDISVVCQGSLWLFGFTVISSGSCVALAEA